jgi:hypothetical protein
MHLLLKKMRLMEQASAAGVVTLSGEVQNEVSAFSPREVGIRVNTDGTIDKRTSSTTYTQIDSGTDWIIPNIDASTDYEFRVTNVVWTSGSSFNIIDASPEDVWIDLTGGALEWSAIDPTPGSGGKIDVTFDLEVRKGSGSTLDTAVFDLTANYT